MDIMNNAEDEALLREFWGGKEGGKIRGMTVQSIGWHK